MSAAALLLGLLTLTGNDTTLASAERAARAWLEQLDRAQYDSAYSQVVPAMRSEIALQPWIESVRALRAELPRGERMRIRAEHGVRMFGGVSVLLTFRAGTAAGPREVIVMIRERTRWRIGGYGVLRE